MRQSARLAVVALLVFSLNLGTVAACTQHDLADLGLGTSSDHAAVMQADHVNEGDSESGGSLNHAGACNYCGCHHASTTPRDIHVATVQRSCAHLDCIAVAPLSTSLYPDLRPPIL